MRYAARVNIFGMSKPTRAYFCHTPDSRLAQLLPTWEGAIGHVAGIVESNRELQRTDFLIPFVWREDGTLVTEIFGYSGLHTSNQANTRRAPNSWVFTEGKMEKPAKLIIHEGLSALYAEENDRMNAESFAQYAANPPRLGRNLEPPLDFTVDVSRSPYKVRGLDTNALELLEDWKEWA